MLEKLEKDILFVYSEIEKKMIEEYGTVKENPRVTFKNAIAHDIIVNSLAVVANSYYDNLSSPGVYLNLRIILEAVALLKKESEGKFDNVNFSMFLNQIALLELKNSKKMTYNTNTRAISDEEYEKRKGVFNNIIYEFSKYFNTEFNVIRRNIKIYDGVNFLKCSKDSEFSYDSLVKEELPEYYSCYKDCCLKTHFNYYGFRRSSGDFITDRDELNSNKSYYLDILSLGREALIKYNHLDLKNNNEYFDFLICVRFCSLKENSDPNLEELIELSEKMIKTMRNESLGYGFWYRINLLLKDLNYCKQIGYHEEVYVKEKIFFEYFAAFTYQNTHDDSNYFMRASTFGLACNYIYDKYILPDSKIDMINENYKKDFLDHYNSYYRYKIDISFDDFIKRITYNSLFAIYYKDLPGNSKFDYTKSVNDYIKNLCKGKRLEEQLIILMEFSYQLSLDCCHSNGYSLAVSKEIFEDCDKYTLLHLGEMMLKTLKWYYEKVDKRYKDIYNNCSKVWCDIQRRVKMEFLITLITCLL